MKPFQYNEKEGPFSNIEDKGTYTKCESITFSINNDNNPTPHPTVHSPVESERPTDAGAFDIGMFEIHTERIDPYENVPSHPDAEITFLDSTALKFWHKKRTDFEIPPYYSESAFGRNVKPALQRLLDGGFIEVAGLEKAIALKTVPELKEILAAKGLKVSGTKATLISRLQENLSDEELKELFPVSVYQMTERGERAMQYYSVIKVNSSYGLGLSFYRLMNERISHPDLSDEEILSNMLSQDILDAYQRQDESTLKNLLVKMASFMHNTGNPEKAFEYNVAAFFLWSQEATRYNLTSDSQGHYMSKAIEKSSVACGYTLDQLLDSFPEIIHKFNLFGLDTEDNIQDAIILFKTNLGI